MESTSPLEEQYSASEEQLKFAGFWVRYAASFLDAFIIGIPILLLVFCLAFISGKQLALSETENIKFPLNLIPPLLIWSYHIFFVTKTGATPGKKFLKIKVLQVDQKPVSLGKAILRETIGKILSGLFFSLGYIWAAFDNKKQAWHDKIAKTYVVYTETLSRGRKIAAFLIAFLLPIIAVIGILAVIILVAINPMRQIGQAKDAQRKGDIIQLRQAIELYYAEKSTYPRNLLELSPKWIKMIPRDPKTNSEYFYQVLGENEGYVLRATLSNGEPFEVKTQPPPRQKQYSPFREILHETQ